MQNDLTYSCVVFHIFPNTLLANTNYSEHCEELLAVTRVALEFGNVKDDSCSNPPFYTQDGLLLLMLD